MIAGRINGHVSEFQLERELRAENAKKQWSYRFSKNKQDNITKLVNTEKIIDNKAIELFKANPTISKSKFVRLALSNQIDQEATESSATNQAQS